MADARREGFHDPIYCPRGRNDCRALAQIIGEGHASFVCCGQNDGLFVAHAQDGFRFCHKSPPPAGVDVLMDHDIRDLSHIAAVYGWALAAVMPLDPRDPRSFESTQGGNKEKA